MTRGFFTRRTLPRPLQASLPIGALLVGLGIAWSSAVAEENAPPAPKADAKAAEVQRLGHLFKITLPITGQTTDHLRPAVRKAIEDAQAAQSKPILIFQFVVPKGQSKFGTGSKIGNAYDLASYLSSDALSGATTVAYIPQTIQGHAVLAALACDQIVMAPDAEIGPAGVDEPAITPDILAFYKGIAERRKRMPTEVALKLVDPSRELLEVQTDLGTEYTTPQGLPELRKRRTITSEKTLFKANVPGQFSGNEARQKGFVTALAAERAELPRVLELPADKLYEDFAPEGAIRAVRVDLKGPVTKDAVDKAQRMISDALRRQDANLILVRIDSAGGSPADSMELATFLASDLEPSKVRTVAFIPREARADAALVALACDHIVMQPQAVLGGEGNYTFSPKEIEEMAPVIKQIASHKSRAWSLPLAMYDTNLAVFRCTKGGSLEFFSDEELAKQPNAKQWVRGDQVNAAGKPFLIRGVDAKNYSLGIREVEEFGQLKTMYGLENDPTLLEPGWVDTLVDALAHPGVRVLLLIIGFVALYAEMHSPGIGVAAFVALVCFALFFWSQFLGGTAGWLEVVLFVAGLACLLLEIFVIPGFGIFGLGGAIMILASLIFASQTFIIPRNAYEMSEFQTSLFTVGSAIVGIIAAIVLLNRWLPEAPMFGRMVLQPPSEEEAEAISESESLTHFENLLGVRGTATTPLVPGGKARLGDEVYDVMTDGQFVQRGDLVEVVELRGNWIVVRPVEETA